MFYLLQPTVRIGFFPDDEKNVRCLVRAPKQALVDASAPQYRVTCMNTKMTDVIGLVLACLWSVAGTAEATPPADDGGLCDYQTIAMLAEYEGEEFEGGYYDTPVAYLNGDARKPYLIDISHGRVFDGAGHPVDARQAEFTHQDGAGLYAIFVMDECGRIYLTFHHSVGEFHHSSFLAGAPVSSAGEMLIVDGQILEITNSSGHYRPDSRLAMQVVDQLKLLGADLSMVLVEMSD